jgi:hypothetical protein
MHGNYINGAFVVTPIEELKNRTEHLEKLIADIATRNPNVLTSPMAYQLKGMQRALEIIEGRG